MQGLGKSNLEKETYEKGKEKRKEERDNGGKGMVVRRRKEEEGRGRGRGGGKLTEGHFCPFLLLFKK